jgi:hypothetical protein
MGKQGMVDENRIALKRCTHASVRRMDLQILRSKALSRDGGLLANLVGILIGGAVSVAADTYARTYVTDLFYWKKAVE